MRDAFAAVFFDLDGLLIDTERLGLVSIRETATRHGACLDEAIYLDLVGVSAADGLAQFRQRLAAQVEVDVFIADWTQRFREQVETSPTLLMPGADALLDTLRRQAIPVCLVTNSARTDAHWKLDCAGIAGHFEQVITVDDVPRGKPDPAIYRLAAARLGVAPQRALALEDSRHGVASALSAGMQVLQVCGEQHDDTAPARVTVLHTLEDARHWLFAQNNSQDTSPG